MATPTWEFFNIYNNPEHTLFKDIHTEYTDITGFPIKYYIKTSIEDADTLYGEDTTTTFTSAGYDTKVVYQPAEDANIIDIFGWTPDDVVQFAMIPKAVFTRDIAIPYGDSTLIPAMGDVIVMLWDNKRYEVTNIGSEQSVFLGQKLIWEFTLTPYRFSEESDSAENIVERDTSTTEFPDINDPGFDTQELSGFGDNDWIEDESDDIDANPDSSIYGY